MRATQNDTRHIAARVDAAWSERVSQLGLSLPPQVASELRRAWLSKEYARLIEEALAVASQKWHGVQDLDAGMPCALAVSPPRGASTVARGPVKRLASDASTPQKKRLCGEAPKCPPQQSQAHATEITHHSAAALHEGAVSLHEHRNRFVGSIVSVDGQLRAGGKYERNVFTATLEDETAPIRVGCEGGGAT